MAPKNQPPVPIPSSAAQEVALDFSTVKPFEPLDERDAEGKDIIYLSKIEKAPYNKAKNYINVELTIEKPATKGVVKRKLFRIFSFKLEALPFVHAFFQAADPSVVLDEKFRYKESQWIGLKIAHTVKNEPYTNPTTGVETVQTRIDKIYSASKYVE